MTSLWSAPAALVGTSIGVLLVYLSLLGSTMTTSALRELSARVARRRGKRAGEGQLDEDLLRMSQVALLLDFESTAILYKIVQSVGLGFHLGLVFAFGAFGIGQLSERVEGAMVASTWLLNASFVLVLIAALLIVIAYAVHRLSYRKLRGLQEWLHLVRLRLFVRC